MRILYFSYVNLDRPNACQTHTLGLLRGFSENHCRVDAVVPRPLVSLPRIPSVSFHFLPPHQGSRRNLLTAIPLSLLTLFRLCRQHHYQALYARDMDVFIGPRWCSKIFGLPLYLEVDDSPVEGHYPPLLHKLVEANLRADYRQASGLIVPSVPRCRLLSQGFGASPQKVHMVLNGTDLPASRPLARPKAKAQLGLPVEGFCLGYVGSVNERYDFETMLQALGLCQEKIPQVSFLIVGDGSHLDWVKSRARQLGLSNRVLFTGFLKPKALVRVVPAMDLGLMNLLADEVRRHGPIHTKAATYGLFGLPVITAGGSLEGYPAELRDSLFLVPPEDPQALAEACVQFSKSPKERTRLGSALKNYIRRHLTWRSVAKDILEIMATREKRLAIIPGES